MLEAHRSPRDQHASSSLGFGDAANPQDVGMAEVGGIVSRTLGLPADNPEVMHFASALHGTINRDPVLRHAVQHGGGIQSFVLSQAPPELIAKLDPARRAEAERQRTLQNANRTDAGFAAAMNAMGGGRWASLQGDRGHGDGGSGGNGKSRDASGAGPMGASSSGAYGGRTDYGAMSYSTPESLRGVNAGNFAATPFARQGGMDFKGFNYVRNFDRNFNGHDILGAAKQVKDNLGLSPHDHQLVAHQALIEHYDKQKKQTNQHMVAFKKGLESSPELKAAAAEYKAATTPEGKAAAKKKVDAAIAHEAEKSGVRHDAFDPAKHPKAQQGIRHVGGKVGSDGASKAIGQKYEWRLQQGDPAARAYKPGQKGAPATPKGTGKRADAADDKDADLLGASQPAKLGGTVKAAEASPPKTNKPAPKVMAAKSSPSPAIG